VRVIGPLRRDRRSARYFRDIPANSRVLPDTLVEDELSEHADECDEGHEYARANVEDAKSGGGCDSCVIDVGDHVRDEREDGNE